jgi:long-chain acyl-CoA synthetase
VIRTDLIRPIPELLERAAERDPNKLAFRDASRSLSYGELRERTGRLAGHLRSSGVGGGDRVAILLKNGVPFVESYLAIARAGAIGVPVNSAAAQPEIEHMLSDSGARVVITDADEPPDVDRVIGVDELESLAAADPSVGPADDLDLHDPAWILYTSGTTGRPKGVVLTQHGFLWVVAACWAPIAGYSSDEYALSPLPLFHSYALNVSVMAPLALGASEYVMERFSTEEVLRLLRSDEFTFFPGVPTMFHYLLHAARDEGLRARALRICVSAGAIMPAALNEEFEAELGVTLVDGYGITETSTMVTQSWPVGTRPMGSCGLPVPGSAVRIVDPATGKDVPRGERGELIVRGPHVMLGYHQREKETAETLRGGWYHTGDEAVSDENGYLTITGRIKELIIRGGENIAPFEVEEVASRHEAIFDCAVVGRPHPELGEVPVLFAVPEDGAEIDPEDVQSFCRSELSAFKVPAEVYVVDEIPKTGSGKIKRHELAGRMPAEA